LTFGVKDLCRGFGEFVYNGSESYRNC